MTKNKQTSVEWLFCALIDRGYKNPHDMELIAIIEEAEEMHAQEIIAAYEEDYLSGECGGPKYLSGAEYYNAKFADEN